MNLKERLDTEIFPSITKPSRYLGSELHSVHKNPRDVELRVALVFPDLYDLGLGNLGVHILYAILNKLPWCWAERAYAPAPDMAEALRGRGLPLFALESKDPLGAMDMLGFSLQSELTYTSVLYILDLAGIPLRAADRNESHPIVFAGGPAAINPEPMAAFFDFLVIGDGEQAIVEVAEVAREKRGGPRTELLEAMARLRGVYVPTLYEVPKLGHHPQSALRSATGGVPDGQKVVRRIEADLDLAEFPAEYIVPYAQLIHDRIGLEIMRGCTHGCRFCQAGVTTRPVRARSRQNIAGLMDRLIQATGYEEVSLVSLSTCDYPGVRSLLRDATVRAQRDNVAVSVPSLRLDTFSIDVADAVTGMRRSGLTFAPEAATPRLRAVINKWFDEEELFEVAGEAFKRGWQHIKLYFMIGLPTETDEDVEAIPDLCLRLLSRGKSINRRARIFTGISTFVPKPFTPFQWEAQISIDEVRRRQQILERGFKRNPGIKYGRHDPESTFIEGLLARAGSDAAGLIEAAYGNGARLDSSSELLDFNAWLAAIDETGYSVEQALDARDPEAPLPWDHIDALVSKDWLRDERDRAMALEETVDCRTGRCSQCGVRDDERGLCLEMWSQYREAEKDEARQVLVPLPTLAEPPPAQRVRFQIGRLDEARFLSNLEMMSAWARTLRRAGAPLSYSQGFHAHPKVTFATAPPVGEESEADYMDVVLREKVDPLELADRVRATVPPGFHVYAAEQVPLATPSLMSAVTGFDYALYTKEDAGEMQRRIDNLLAKHELIVERKGKPQGRSQTREISKINIRPLITTLDAKPAGALTEIQFNTTAINNKLAKPRELIALLGLDPPSTRVVKKATKLDRDEQQR
ncbi:MAG TPA: TIGR03960 family B12-binding radical SAM protein [Candidatus Bathyarchaeia archaeon]|nr:TIGR03960 family B12-binding radical SAM protein [Candidatus Bathyarchaeia archaeon]